MKARIASIIVAALLVGLTVEAQVTPLHFGTTNRVIDEFGNLLKGTDVAAADFGFPIVTGDLVQILHAEGGVYPPSTNGAPHASNSLVAVTRIGVGVDPAAGQSGKFSGAITTLDRGDPNANIKIIARVFNKPTLEDASFYADSQVYTVPVFGQSYGVFSAEIHATTQMLDSTDYDHDGLVRSWEKSYGANPDNPDSDGDGMADGPEIRAGTGVTDAGSLLAMVQLIPRLPNNLDLSWDTVVGKSYQVEYTLDDLTNSPSFTAVGGVISATSAVSRTTVVGGLLTPKAHYRVRLVE